MKEASEAVADKKTKENPEKKQRTVSSVLASLSKTYNQAFADVKKAGTIQRVYLESPSLNYLFCGGFGLGRVYEFYGPESGGKSTLATYIGGEIQKKCYRPITVYVDFEVSFDEAYANRLGLNTEENFIFLRPTTGEEGFNIVAELVKELPVGLIVWDSIATTPSAGQVADAFKASFGGTASVMASGLKMLNPLLARHNTSIIFINQERANQAMFGGDTKTTGGYAAKFYASWRGRISKSETIKNKGMVVGIQTAVRNKKSKIGPPFRETVLNLFFDQGFDSNSEYLQFIIDLDIVDRAGSWFNKEEWGLHVQGREALLQFLKDRPELFETVKQQVNDILSRENKLDAENEISDEEKKSLAEEALDELDIV